MYLLYYVSALRRAQDKDRAIRLDRTKDNKAMERACVTMHASHAKFPRESDSKTDPLRDNRVQAGPNYSFRFHVPR